VAHKERKSKKEKKRAKDSRRRDRGPGSPATASDDERVEGAVPAAASGSQLAVLPTDNSVLSIDFVNSLASSINGLVTSVKDLHIGMATLQQESREQRGQISSLVGELQSMRTAITTNNNNYKKDMQNMNKEIEEKLAKLRASSGTALPSPAGAASSSSGGPSSSPPTAPAAAAAGSPAGGGHRPTRIWIKGFKEVLTTKYLNDFARKAVDRLPPDLRVGASTGAPGFGSTVYIDYPTTTRVAPIRMALQALNLKHTDESGTEHSLRIHPDIPLAVRHKGRVLGELWRVVEPHIANLEPPLRPASIKLGSSNGKLFLILDHRPLELFATSLDGQGTLHVTPNTNNLKKYNVDEAMAQAWVSSACRSASRGGQ
jgi:hypothetical protein